MNVEELTMIVAQRSRLRTQPLRPPMERDWRALETTFGCKFPSPFYDFHRLYSIYDIGGGWLPIAPDIDPLSPDTPSLVAQVEQESGRKWNPGLVPIYELGNGDYVCLLADEGVASRAFFVDHETDGVTILKQDFLDFVSDIEWLPQVT